MAIPTIVTLTENEWVIVATGVTTGIIDRKATGIKYYQTYRNTGDTSPTSPTSNQIPEEAIELLTHPQRTRDYSAMVGKEVRVRNLITSTNIRDIDSTLVNHLIQIEAMVIATSIPELVVGVTSAIEGVPELSLGNVLGSNVVNLSLIIGTAVLISGKVNFKDNEFKNKITMPFFLALLPVLLAIIAYFGGMGLKKIGEMVDIGEIGKVMAIITDKTDVTITSFTERRYVSKSADAVASIMIRVIPLK